MTKKWIAINIALLLSSGLLGWRLYTSAVTFKAQNDVAKIQPPKDPKQKIVLEGGLPPLQAPRPYNVADFSAVPAQNVFSDTRTKDEPPPAAPAVAEAPPLTVRPVLVGVVLAGEQKLASVIEPTQAGGPHRSLTRRLGDTYQGYTITDITRDQMVLERGNRREVIPLFDSAKHPAQGAAAQSGRTPILPTRVVSIGGGGAATGAQPVVPGRGPVTPASSAAAAKPAATPAQGRGQQVNVGRQEAQAGAPQATRPGAPATAPTQRIIRTPFGDIVRPEP